MQLFMIYFTKNRDGTVTGAQPNLLQNTWGPNQVTGQPKRNLGNPFNSPGMCIVKKINKTDIYIILHIKTDTQYLRCQSASENIKNLARPHFRIWLLALLLFSFQSVCGTFKMYIFTYCYRWLHAGTQTVKLQQQQLNEIPHVRKHEPRC